MSILSTYSSNDVNKWMMDIVALSSSGMMYKGIYGGYGDIQGDCISSDGEHTLMEDHRIDEDGSCIEIYHKACWEQVGRPDKFTSESENADDQGFFFDDKDMQIPEPRRVSGG